MWKITNTAKTTNLPLSSQMSSDNTPKKGKKKPVINPLTGKEFRSELALCQSAGLPVHTYYYRRSNGMSIRETLEKGYASNRPIPCIDPRTGIEYKSERALCQAFGIKRPTYEHRKKRGWTLEERIYGKEQKSKRGEKLNK